TGAAHRNQGEGTLDRKSLGELAGPGIKEDCAARKRDLAAAIDDECVEGDLGLRTKAQACLAAEEGCEPRLCAGGERIAEEERRIDLELAVLLVELRRGLAGQFRDRARDRLGGRRDWEAQ